MGLFFVQITTNKTGHEQCEYPILAIRTAQFFLERWGRWGLTGVGF
jgi:hypothetical protein